MKLEHSFTVPASIEEAWATFNDLERVVPCFPGATLSAFDSDEFVGSVKVKLGPVSLQYNGTGTFVERDPETHHAVVEAKGKDRRGNGTATARVTAQLTPSGESETAVTVETDLTVTGRPAQFGRGLMQEVSDKLLGQFVDCLTKELGTTGTTTPSTPTPDTAEPSPGALSGAASSATSSGQAMSGQATSGPAMSGQAASGQAAPGSAMSGQAASGQAASGQAPSGQAMPGQAMPGQAPSGRPTSGDGRSKEAKSGEATLNLASTLAPALARRLAPYLIGAVLALVLRRILRR
jgi:carbon monoxide dehydrogenase subunit G